MRKNFYKVSTNRLHYVETWYVKWWKLWYICLLRFWAFWVLSCKKGYVLGWNICQYFQSLNLLLNFLLVTWYSSIYLPYKDNTEMTKSILPFIIYTSIVEELQNVTSRFFFSLSIRNQKLKLPIFYIIREGTSQR